MRILHLYRPRLPGTRAQSIQVLHACHALARLGHEVTLLADRDEQDKADPLVAMGLEPLPGLDLRQSPTSYAPAAGWWFRAQVLSWWAGAPGVVLARDKRRLRWLLRVTAGSRRHRLVLEAHELDSAIAIEAGEDPKRALRLESWVLSRVDGLITNCGGTMALWEQAWGEALPPSRVVAHNAVSPDRRRGPRNPEALVRCVGSLRAYKGIEGLARAAAALPIPLELVGGTEEERRALVDLPANVRLRAAVPYPEVPDLLARSAVLLLPLADNLFGRCLTSPLKLWDYLATSVPIVAPDLPSVREIQALTGAPMHTYDPARPEDLPRAVAQALSAPPRGPFVRTWLDRARETLPVLLGPAG